MLNFFGKKYKNRVYFALIDGVTKNLFIMNKSDLNALLWLSDFVMDSRIVEVPLQNYFHKKFLDMLISSEEKYLYQWNWAKKSFIKYKDEKAAELEKDRFQLVFYKYKVLCAMLTKIESVRSSNKKFLLFQDHIYLEKTKEAEGFLLGLIKDTDTEKLKYLSQYAQLENISLQLAAEAIFNKHQLAEAVNLKTEKVRLKYFTLLATAKSVEDLKQIYADFQQEI